MTILRWLARAILCPRTSVSPGDEMLPTALFFDLDNTLVDDDASVHRCIERAYEAMGLHHLGPASGFAADLEARNANYWESTQPKRLTLHEARLRFWGEALTAAGCDDPAVLIAAVEAYAAFRLEPPLLYDDAIEVLDQLHRRVPLAIVTNGTAEQQRLKLEGSNLTRYFDLVVAMDDAGASKPEAAMFHHALNRLSLTEAATVWHIGDSLANDVTGAHNAGLRSVWLNRNGALRAAHHPEPHHEIASLRELVVLLEGLADDAAD
jgi:HAD superfamily hydrolase (TIGR01549 family)